MVHGVLGMLAMSAEVDYDNVSFVISSGYRESVLFELFESGPRTPTEIEDNTSISIAHASRALASLREEGLVDLLVSEDRMKGRIYGLTDEGKKTAQVIEERA